MKSIEFQFFFMTALGKPQAIVSEELAEEQSNQGEQRLKTSRSTNATKRSKNLTPNFSNASSITAVP